MGVDPEPSDVGDGDSRRTDPAVPPVTERDALPSSVRASAPTIQGDSDPGVTPRKPIVIRTPLPPKPIDQVVPQLSTTTPTGMAVRSDAPPISNTLRSGGPRTLVGASLGRYEIAEEVGHGGMATVYRARDPRLERDVALKVIHRHLRDNPEIAHRFAHEARAVAKLKHPSIVEIYDVPDLDDEERFLVAEFVDGPSLRRYLQDLQKELGHDRPGLLPPEIAAALVLQVLSALARAHEEGIVHRDIKPENILVAGLRGEASRDSARSSQRQSDPSRPPVVAKLTDFGIAKILDAQSMTSTGQILGSPAHMAPEQIESGDITARVDVFATGVLFYELLTGSLPFDGKNPAQVIRRVLEGEFTPADRVAPTVGGRWSAIVAAMLARDPERRPADADAVAQLIREELTAMGVTDPDRELLDFIKAPRAVADGWAARVKPILFERAMAARERGDVVGSAHDLNRALAYDPTDPKLVRAVTTMRTRERRLRGVRRAIPVAIAGVFVAGGTFGVVRWSRMNVAPQPSVAATATSAVASGGPNEAVSDISTVPALPDSVAPPKPTPAIPVPIISVPAADAASNKRRVRFSMFPAGKYQIDNGPTHDSFTDPVQELTVGEHTITITGNANCCEILTKSFRVVPGETEQSLEQFRLAFRPAKVNVSGAEGAKLTVRGADGSTIAAGTAPLDVKVTESTAVSVTIEVTGFPAKTVNVTLAPGDARWLEFDK